MESKSLHEKNEPAEVYLLKRTPLKPKLATKISMIFSPLKDNRKIEARLLKYTKQVLKHLKPVGVLKFQMASPQLQQLI